LVATPAGPLTVTFAGRHLYSRHRPEQTVQAQVRALSMQPDTLYLALSPLLGYGLQELIERLPAGSHVLALECLDPLSAASHGGGTQLDSIVVRNSARCGLLDAATPVRAARLLQEIGIGRFRRVATVALSGGYQLARDRYAEIALTLEAEVRTHWQNRLTLIAMGRLWARNLIENLAAMPGASDAAGLGTDAAVVVCGAGPTLSDGLPWLRAQRQHFFLIAVDTALATLCAFGIRPDLVFVLEAQHANVADFVPCVDPSLPVIADLTSCPAVLRLFHGPRYLYSSRYAPVSVLRRLEEHGLLPLPMPPLGSVGVAAVAAALRMTSAAVIAVGLDFAYAHNVTHARGAPSHLALLATGSRLAPALGLQADAIYRRPLLRTESKQGGTILTDLVLDSYAVQLRRLSRGASRVYDLAGPGLPIAATTLDAAAATKLVAASAPPGGPAPAVPSYDTAGVRRFIQDERRVIQTALRWLAADVATVVRPLHLEPLDYLYVDLPEAPLAAREPQQPFLDRVQVRGAEALQRLERVSRRVLAA
jgi:hypothetical protein